MTRKNQNISLSLKTEIMEAAKIPGSIICEIARNYNISPKLLYAWRSIDNKYSGQKTQSQPKNASDFVELSIDKAMTQVASLPLKKVSLELEFEDFSFELVGNLSSKKLMQLIKMLEQPC